MNFKETNASKGTHLGMKLNPMTTPYGFHLTKSIFIKSEGFFVLFFVFVEFSNLSPLRLILPRKPQMTSGMCYLAVTPEVITALGWGPSVTSSHI